MDQETWRFINTFAPWAAALATFSAVVVSLRLARKGNRIELKLRAGIRNVGRVTGPGGRCVLLRVGVRIKTSQNPLQLVWVGITNIGRRSATITHIYLRPLPWLERGLFLTPSTPASSFSMDFPITLDDGKSADYGWPLQDFAQRQTPEFRDEFGGVCGAVKVRLSRLWVSTSTGDEFQRDRKRSCVRSYGKSQWRKNDETLVSFFVCALVWLGDSSSALR